MILDRTTDDADDYGLPFPLGRMIYWLTYGACPECGAPEKASCTRESGLAPLVAHAGRPARWATPRAGEERDDRG